MTEHKQTNTHPPRTLLQVERAFERRCQRQMASDIRARAAAVAGRKVAELHRGRGN